MKTNAPTPTARPRTFTALLLLTTSALAQIVPPASTQPSIDRAKAGEDVILFHAQSGVEMILPPSVILGAIPSAQSSRKS